MTNSLPVVQMIMHAISKQHTTPHGEDITVTDDKFLKYQLMYVNTDNFAAFVQALENVLSTKEYVCKHCIPAVGQAIDEIITNMASAAMVSIAGKSSENGKYIKLLMQDIQENRIVYSDVPENQKSSILSRFGPAPQQGQPQQQR